MDCIEVLRSTRHKTGHFGDNLPSQSIELVLKNTMKANTHL